MEEYDCDYEQEDIIPGDNDKPSAEENAPGAPANLTHILPQGGDIPIILEPTK